MSTIRALVFETDGIYPDQQPALSERLEREVCMVIRSLMLCDNLGDVHDEIFTLCDFAEIPRPEGGFEEDEGWAPGYWESVDVFLDKRSRENDPIHEEHEG